MEEILLYVNHQSSMSSIFLWAGLIGAILLSIWLLYYQHGITKNLDYELKQLDKVKKHNVEYELILKAMHLSTWHLDVRQRQMTFDNDFREGSDSYAPLPGTPLEEVFSVIEEPGRQLVIKNFEDLVNGRLELGRAQYKVNVPHSKDTYWADSYATIAERDVDGKPITIAGATMRIDEQKSIENELITARNRAEESDRLKTAFVANISHEIRTPLNAIVGFTGILPDVTDEEERKSLLGLVNENTTKLLRIIDDVVSISKIEAGEEELVMTNFELGMILSEHVDRCQHDCKPGVTMTTQFACEAQMVTSDLNRVCEILKHLLNNAVKFTDAGSIVVGYDAPVDGRIRVWVRDTGKGIAPENHERIFERFFKVDEFIPGAGLGLSLCRTLAYSLGGQVGVESVLNEGSTFWFEMPIQ
ncbi:MAG: HAMP domain-containing histidine kinase [Prevotella sp.]|nr:HAMP domain-containing histidine kinase [Prevotella sp.]